MPNNRITHDDEGEYSFEQEAETLIAKMCEKLKLIDDLNE
jgi:hypothetical protein